MSEYLMIGTMVIQLVIGFILLFLAVGIFNWAFTLRKSQYYRKTITDMYVAAKTRFLAKRDELDLAATYISVIVFL
jgi:uncharacterized metal-binding protein